jgi:phosphoglycolate phosphatase-like HAD superfamily hydrolase
MNGIGVEKVLMIGDRVEDMLAINDLKGSNGVGIATGSHSREMLLNAGAIKVYKDFSSLYLDFKDEEENQS